MSLYADKVQEIINLPNLSWSQKFMKVVEMEIQENKLYEFADNKIRNTENSAEYALKMLLEYLKEKS